MSRESGKTYRLFEEFPPVSPGEWKDLILADLGGADYEKTLVWKTYEGLRVEPFYTIEDIEGLAHLRSLPGEFPYIRGSKPLAQWSITEEIGDNDPRHANEVAKEGLNRGLDCLTFRCEYGSRRVRGVRILSQGDMSRILKDIPIDRVPINFIAGFSPIAVQAMLAAEVEARGLSIHEISGCIMADPLSHLATYGSLPTTRKDVFNELSRAVSFAESKAPRLRCLSASSHPFHEAGASAVEELAFTLSEGAEYLAELTDLGISASAASRHMVFRFSIGSNYFMEIAKLRAARMLWAHIVRAFGSDDEESFKMTIYARTSLRNKTIYDPYVNMLRVTTEAMSAAVGGADYIAVGAFDELIKPPDDFSRRIARNTQLILKNESYVEDVIDPAAGSYYIEMLTDMLADAAWKLFLSVEKEGGFIEALQKGFIQGKIETTRKEKERNIALRKDMVLGTNNFPNLKERMLPLIKKVEEESPFEILKGERATLSPESIKSVEALAKAFRCGEISVCDLFSFYGEGDLSVSPLHPVRAAEPFEQIRLATEAYAQRTGKTPSVFLLPYGNLASRLARANFSLNLFGCAGFEVVENPGFQTVMEGVEAAVASSCDIVVICSADEEYPHIAPWICKGIKEHRPKTLVVVAGYPKSSIEMLKEAGIDDFIHIRMDAVDALKRFQRLLGITEAS
ncbi:MAG: methylmalonyl-CoA mutase family protein [Candidatus Caldarchaeum sp.]